MLGAHSSSDDEPWRAHVDFLFSRPALLGKAQAYAGSAAWRVVGCKQDWFVSSTHRDRPRLARLLSRSAAYPLRLLVSLGTGFIRSRKSRKMPAAWRFVDLWTRCPVRAPRRRQRCRVSVRIHDRPRW